MTTHCDADNRIEAARTSVVAAAGHLETVKFHINDAAGYIGPDEHARLGPVMAHVYRALDGLAEIERRLDRVADGADQ